jgi:arylsulfatase A
LLYNIDHDPGEQFDIAARHPEIIARIRKIASDHGRTIAPVENQLIRTDARH